jgi:hypothetical protein
MSDPSAWWGANERCLAAGLAWLRLRLSPDGGGRARADAALEAAEAADPPPALAVLGRAFGLSRFERRLLLLCAAADLDPAVPALCAAAGDPGRPFPTFALALAHLDEPAWDALAPGRPLRRWRLVEVQPREAEPLTACPLRADERVVHFLKGLNQLDERLAALLRPEEAGADDLTPSQRAVVDRVVRLLERAAGGAGPPRIHLVGEDRAAKRATAACAAARLGLHLHRLAAEDLPAGAEEAEALARLWGRESALAPVALYLDAHEAEPRAALRFLERTEGLLFLDTREPVPDPRAAAFEVGPPTPEEQEAAWAEALGPGAAGCARELAGQFTLGPSAIRAVAEAARAEGGGGAGLRERLWDACVLRTRPRLEALARRIDARAGWDDLVLPPAETGLLRQLVAHVRHRRTVYGAWGFGRRTARGLGVAALFAGESGTGKTLAAEVVAAALRLPLYRIDLSAVVSKYVGETEKNLRRLFDAAEGGGAALFFDEADALFGKRGEVKDSHDRYANIEVNYLLQRLEAYRGLAVLATNFKAALDPAFLRRLRFVVQFPFPGPAERAAIWRRSFPPEAPCAGLDWERLAQLNLTGGSIHNVALHAAFLAADAGTPITPDLVRAAARDEFRKLERPVSEADFRW